MVRLVTFTKFQIFRMEMSFAKLVWATDRTPPPSYVTLRCSLQLWGLKAFDCGEILNGMAEQNCFMFAQGLSFCTKVFMWLLFQLNTLQDACETFLKNQLEPHNCLGIAQFASSHECVDLYNAATCYARRNFWLLLVAFHFKSVSMGYLLIYTCLHTLRFCFFFDITPLFILFPFVSQILPCIALQ